VSAVLLAMTFVVVTVSTAIPDSAQANTLRWELEEKPYDQMGIPEKVGSNVRRGVLGIVDSLANALFSAVVIASPYGGTLISKLSTGVGDVVGLVDNNPATKYVTQGIISRQFLRFGSQAAKMTRALGVIHDTEFKGGGLDPDAYLGDVTFHTKAYGHQSSLATLGTVILSDILIRPAGSFITIFGARDMGERMNEYGLDLIQKGTEVNFL
jgi:hypothetical protein